MVVRCLFGLTSMGSMLRVAKGLQTFTDRTAREIVRSVTRPQGAPSYFTDPKAPAPRVPKLNTYVEARAVRRPLAEVLRKVNDFAHGLHSDWRKTNAGSGRLPSGEHMVFLIYEATVSFDVQLIPRTLAARIQENLSSNDPRYDYAVEAVPYRYRCRVELIAKRPDETVVRYETQEMIAMFGRVRRDLRKHYEAPPMPDGFGMIGQRLLENL